METPRQLADAIAALVRAPNGPCALGAIQETEDRLYVRLPDDVREFFARMNGTVDMTDVDHGLITLWPLEQCKRLDDEVPAFAGSPVADAIVFADHSIWCWAYAARFPRDNPDTMRIWMVEGPQSVLIAETFSQFVKMIVSKDAGLYGRFTDGALNPTLAG
jgi:hypothetical protein